MTQAPNRVVLMMLYRSSRGEGGDVAEDDILDLTVILQQPDQRLGNDVHLVARGDVVVQLGHCHDNLPVSNSGSLIDTTPGSSRLEATYRRTATLEEGPTIPEQQPVVLIHHIRFLLRLLFLLLFLLPIFILFLVVFVTVAALVTALITVERCTPLLIHLHTQTYTCSLHLHTQTYLLAPREVNSPTDPVSSKINLLLLLLMLNQQPAKLQPFLLTRDLYFISIRSERMKLCKIYNIKSVLIKRK